MLKSKKFSASEDSYVVESFGNYQKGDIISGGKIEKTQAVKLWLAGKIKNVGTKVYTEDQLKSMTLKELRAIAAPYGVTDRSKAKLVEEILAVI